MGGQQLQFIARLLPKCDIGYYQGFELVVINLIMSLFVANAVVGSDASEDVCEGRVANLAPMNRHVSYLAVWVALDELEVVPDGDTLLEADVAIAQEVVAVIDQNQGRIDRL